MENNNKVVEIINVLCDKLGVAIDWTSENVLPYVQDIMSRFIKMEIAKSVLNICFIVVIVGFTGCLLIVCGKKAKNTWGEYDWTFWNYGTIVSGVVLGVCLVVALILIPGYVTNIIECTALPEKVFLDYILNYTK